MEKKPVMLMILDGYGINQNEDANAVKQANTPNIDKLMKMINFIVESGGTAVIIEHNLDVIKCADYIIDIGMEGGANGGQIIASGTPEEIVAKGVGYTAKYLKQKLK